jgi:hypothetical protein
MKMSTPAPTRTTPAESSLTERKTTNDSRNDWSSVSSSCGDRALQVVVLSSLAEGDRAQGGPVSRSQGDRSHGSVAMVTGLTVHGDRSGWWMEPR